MSKRKKVLIVCTIILLIILIIVISFLINRNDTQLPNDIQSELPEITKITKLKEIVVNSEYFEEPSFIEDSENNKLTINNKYDIFIKNGYYMMNIKDSKDEEEYCKIVDAVEMSFGATKGVSIETCEMTLDGIINMGGINVEFFDTYKVLTVNSEELSTLYNVLNTYGKEELISLDELNYDVQIDKYLFTSISGGLSSEISMYNICGNLFHPANKEKEFVFTIYDENKEILGENSYQYTNSTKQYLPFCVNFENQIDTVRYFSIR